MTFEILQYNPLFYKVNSAMQKVYLQLYDYPLYDLDLNLIDVSLEL